MLPDEGDCEVGEAYALPVRPRPTSGGEMPAEVVM